MSLENDSFIIYSDLVKTNKSQFITRLQSVALSLGVPVNWLMGVMYIESKLDPQAVNRQAGDSKLNKTPYELALTRATGLIQFMPKTLEAWGLNGQDIYNMSNVDQLEYVQRYFTPYRSKMQSFVDVYFCVFRPAAVGKYRDHVLGGIGTDLAKKIARQNPGLDLNKDEQITKNEVETKILYAIDKNYHKYLTT
jgi:uncharacterized membrane protein YciS (DUF1049 family)